MELMTVKELQDYLGIGRAKAYELVNEPGFPVLRIGRSIRIPKDLLEEWIVERSNGRGWDSGQYVLDVTGNNQSLKKLFTCPSDLNNWTSLYSLYRNKKVKGVKQLKIESVDLRDNIIALYIAILREDIATPEQAFAAIEGLTITRIYNDKDTLDMIGMKEQGLGYEEISQIYGLTKDAVRRRIERYKKRTSQTAIWKGPAQIKISLV